MTVKAYQIVKANYFKPSDPQQGFAGYEVVEDAGKDFMEEIKDSNGVVQTDESGNPKYRIIYPTSNDISRLAQSISALSLTAIAARSCPGSPSRRIGALPRRWIRSTGQSR